MEAQSNPFQNRSQLFSQFIEGCNNPFSLLKGDNSSKELASLNKEIQNLINEVSPILFIHENQKPSQNALSKLETFSADRKLDSDLIHHIHLLQKRLDNVEELNKHKKRTVFIRDDKFAIYIRDVNSTPKTSSQQNTPFDNADLLALLSGSKKPVKLFLQQSSKFTVETPEMIGHYGKHLRTLHLSNIPNCTKWLVVLSKKLKKLDNLSLKNSPDMSIEGLACLKNFRLTQLVCSGIAPLDAYSLIHFQNLKKLKAFTLEKTKILCPLPEQFLNASLESLTLKDIDFTNETLMFLKNLPHLKSLSLINCKNLSQNAFQNIKNLAQLVSLNLSHSNFGTEEDLSILTQLVHLKQLNLSHCPVFNKETNPLIYLYGLPLQGLYLENIQNYKDEDLIILAAQCPQLNTIWIKGRKPLSKAIRAALLKYKIGVDEDPS